MSLVTCPPPCENDDDIPAHLTTKLARREQFYAESKFGDCCELTFADFGVTFLQEEFREHIF